MCGMEAIGTDGIGIKCGVSASETHPYYQSPWSLESFKMLRISVLLIAFSTLGFVAASPSLYIYNNCGDTVWAHDVFAGFSQVYAIGSHSGTFVNIPGSNSGLAVNFYTGCSDNSATSCTTGGVTKNSGQTPFIRGEVTWDASGVVYYDISPLYGYNRALKINTDDAGCPGVQCNINSGCPVPGPGGSCYAPCCSSANGCLGTQNCPYDPNYGLNYAGPGVHSTWYHNACPNSYSFPDDDCSHYGHSPLAACGSNNRVTMTLCPTGVSSNIKLC